MNTVVRRAGESDLNELAVLFDGYRQFYGQQTNVEGARNFLRARMQNNESVVYLGELDNGPAGFVQLYPIFTSVGMQRVWLLNDLYVADNARRSGMATALMHAAHQMARDDNAAGVMLETQINNRDAQALYEKLGYRRNEETWFYWFPL